MKNPGGLKRDPFTARMEAGVQWLIRHRQQVGLGAVVVVAAAALAIAVVVNLRKLRQRAWEQLSTAQYHAARGNPKGAMDAVNALLSANKTGPLAVQAHLIKGDLLGREGKMDESIAAYQTALNQSPSDEYRALALAGLAAAFEEAQKWNDAENTQSQFLKEFPEHYLTPRAYEALGRLQMAQNKWSEAQSTFERLITLYPTTSWAKSAQDYLSHVKRQLARPPGK